MAPRGGAATHPRRRHPDVSQTRYATVGAASVLAAAFRAPLTASMLLFELTRDYDVVLPLVASAGVAALVVEIYGEPKKGDG